MVLGTLPYMAPEQVEGKPADARTDLWALGAILYEMITGGRAFEASSATSLIGAILEREPAPLAERQPLTPPSLERLVRRCLAKDPENRWDTAHDVADELRWIGETALAPASREEARRGARLRLLRSVLVALGAGALGAASVWVVRPGVSSPPVVRSLLDVQPAEELNAGSSTSIPTPGGSRTALAWTPDGRAFVFVGRREGVQQLFVRRLDEGEARPLNGTDGAQVPAVSPDGQWVAFWADRTMRKVPLLSGGPVADVTSEVQLPPFGMTWGGHGELYYGHPDGAIWQVAPDGVTSAVTERLETEHSHRLPFVLPGGDALLFTGRQSEWTWGDEEVVAQHLATGERKVLLREAADARYVPSGHLVFLRRGVLFAVAFDPARLEVRGEPVALLDGVAQALVAGNSDHVTGAGQFSVSPDGVLAYVAGGVPSYPDAQLVSVDRQGRVSPLPAPPRPYRAGFRMSPGEERLAVSIGGLTESGIWLFNLGRGTLTRLTSGGEAQHPLWSQDGERVVFNRRNGGVEQLAWQRADGSAPPEVLAEDAGWLSTWSPDGRHLATVKDGDIWIATLDGPNATLRPFTQTPRYEAWPEFSPDGHWLAYASDDWDGRPQVYVQPYPGPGPRTQVSVDGGYTPAWNPAGRELFFMTTSAHPAPPGQRHIMVVDVRTGPTLRLGVPRELFQFSRSDLGFGCAPTRCYDVSSDGQRFFVRQRRRPAPPPPVTHIHLVLGWLEEVKARVPTDR